MKITPLLAAAAFLVPASAHAYQEVRLLDIGGGRLTVQISPEPPPVPLASVTRWVTDAARSVAGYYGRFPVKEVTLKIKTGGHRKIGHGMSYTGHLITINLGREAQEDDLKNDWELTHEMVHLSFPGLDDAYNWMEEGLATYVEPVARARVGLLTDQKYWKDLIDGLPKGLPQAGDQGLDRTHTWGRTYWGGALYWFLADLEIRKRTGNNRSLRDALRAILNAGGSAAEDWELGRVLETGDRATGMPVLKDLHDQWGSSSPPLDLPGLFQQLGVSEHGGSIAFDDKAPLSGLRRAMTRAEGPAPS